MSELNIKLINESTKEVARELRNRNKGYFWDRKHITPSRHNKWFKHITTTQNCFFYIIFLKDKPIGTVAWKLGRIGNAIIDKPYRGQGYFKDVIKQVWKNHPGPSFVIVKKNNVGLQKMYKKLGFKMEMKAFMKLV